MKMSTETVTHQALVIARVVKHLVVAIILDPLVEPHGIVLFQT